MIPSLHLREKNNLKHNYECLSHEQILLLWPLFTLVSQLRNIRKNNNIALEVRDLLVFSK